MMVTVAKSLDVPIKLMFPRPGPTDDPTAPPSHAMLGLGDVVLPGIMIGLALRFDLYLFYLRRQKRIPAVATGEEDKVEKPKYFSLAGRWSDHFWTHSLTGWPLWTSSKADESKPETPFTFPKTYFTASLVGYVLGMLATLGVMMIWNHAQPALLYLVPGVLGSLWLTALVRGELNLMWSYTEEITEQDGSKTTADDKKSVKSSTQDPAKTDKQRQSRSNETPTEQVSADSATEDEQARHVKRVASHRPSREVFSFSIEAPWQLKKPRSVRNESKEGKESNPTHGEKHNWVPSKATSQNPDAEPAGKRLRVK